METWVEATALSIRDKEVKRKSDGRSFTIYTIESDRGEFTTSKRELAEHAFQFLHIPARYLVDTQQNGNFTNNYLQDIAPVPGQSTPQPKPQTNEPASAPAPDNARGVMPDQPKVAGGQGWTEKDLAIYRQTAAKVSASVSRTPEEFWTNLDDILAYFVSGEKPPEWSQS